MANVRGIVELSQVTFNRGLATINGKNFSGVVKHITENGDHIEMEYLKGILKNSKRFGEKNFVKEYTSKGVYTYSGDSLYLSGKDLDIQGRVGDVTSILCKPMPNITIRKNAKGQIVSGYYSPNDGVLCVLAGGELANNPKEITYHSGKKVFENWDSCHIGAKNWVDNVILNWKSKASRSMNKPVE